MRYSPAQLTALQSEIEQQSGAVLNEPCRGELVIYEIEEDGEVQEIRDMTTHCLNKARVIIKYDPGNGLPPGAENRAAGFAGVCVVDDDVGRWPRFREPVNSA